MYHIRYIIASVSTSLTRTKGARSRFRLRQRSRSRLSNLERDTHPNRLVPDRVAVQEPQPVVVQGHAHHDVTNPRHVHGILSDRVQRVQRPAGGDGHGGIEWVVCLVATAWGAVRGEDVEVVAVLVG